MNAQDLITSILSCLDSESPPLPATYIYNEGWMLRLFLQSIQVGQCDGPISAIESDVKWTSEALLATPFSESRGRAYEGVTNADGVVGKFVWRPGTRTALRLTSNCDRFEVIEAKMSSQLSKGVKAASWYDQAVRNVACMAHALQEANISAQQFANIRMGFWVVAPKTQIDLSVFRLEMSEGSIRTKVRMRVEQFSGAGREQLEFWRTAYFEPLLDSMLASNRMRCLSWEELIESVSDIGRRDLLKAFYARCLNPFRQDPTLASSASHLLRGTQCRVIGQNGEVVMVCNVGNKQSRVFEPHKSEKSFLLDNCKLCPINSEIHSLLTPSLSSRHYFCGKEVEVISVGPCRSRVRLVDTPFTEEYVDNHRLVTPPKVNN